MPCSPSSANNRPGGNGLPPRAVTMPTVARRHIGVLFQFGGVNDRQHEVPAFAMHDALDAFFTCLGEHLSRQKWLASFADDDQMLPRRHVNKERPPSHE